MKNKSTTTTIPFFKNNEFDYANYWLGQVTDMKIASG